METCERVQLIAPCARIKISNCRESTFYLGTNTPPVIFGDNHSVKVGRRGALLNDFRHSAAMH